MRRVAWSYKRWGLIASGILVLASCGLLGMMSWPETPVDRRISAQGRWEARPFVSYRVATRVEILNTVCFQEIEIEGETVRRTLHNTCTVSRYMSLSVPRLFEIGQRLEIPPVCYPSSQTCTCQTVRFGNITYDQHLGYPSDITYIREVRVNWSQFDYWEQLWKTKRLPTCGVSSRQIRITVTSLMPLP